MNPRESLWRDRISHLKEKTFNTVIPNATVREAVSTMQSNRLGCLLICSKGRLEGIVTERDLLKKVFGADNDLSRPISSIMTSNPVVCRDDDTIGATIKKMHEGGFRHLPMVDENGRPIGTVSVKRIMQYLVEHFPSTVFNIPPHPARTLSSRDGA